MRAHSMFFHNILALMVALPSAASSTSGTILRRVLPKDSRIWFVLETPIDTSRIFTGDTFSLTLPEEQLNDGIVVLPEATNVQGTVTCFADPALGHVKFVALTLESIQLPNGERHEFSATFNTHGDFLHAVNGLKDISCPAFTTPHCETREANLLGGSGGAASADLLKSRKINISSGRVLPDGMTVLIVRGRNKIVLPIGCRVRLVITKDLQLPNNRE